MGATVTEVTFITADGYVTIPTATYVPVKFVGEVHAEDSAAGTGSTAFALTGFPEDFEKAYAVANGFTVSDDTITYNDAMPGSYTLTVSDKNGKYADYSGSFTLTTDTMPAVYADKKLVKADGAGDAEFANFLKNIAKVTVGETAYSASGKGAVKIIGEDGAIDFDAESRSGKVFDGSGNYRITVEATGYTTALAFEVKADAPETTSAATSAVTTTTSTTAQAQTTTKATGSDVPETGDAAVAVPLTALALAGAAAVFAKRKKK